MGIHPSLSEKSGCNWPTFMAICYNKNVDLAFDAKLTFKVDTWSSRSACVEVELHLKRERDPRVWQRTLGCFKVITQHLCSIRERDPRILWGNVTLTFYEGNVTLMFWQGARGSRLRHFWHPTEPSPKFSIFRGWLEQISKYFGPRVDLDLRNCTNNLLKCHELDLVRILVFVSILLNYFKAPKRIVVSVLLNFEMYLGV